MEKINILACKDDKLYSRKEEKDAKDGGETKRKEQCNTGRKKKRHQERRNELKRR